MKFTNEIENAIKTFIIKQIPLHKNDIVAITMSHFGISKPTATKYVNKLIAEKIIKKKNKGRYPGYTLFETENSFTFSLKDTLEEDVIWRKNVAPLLTDLNDNVEKALVYCFTEMLNNVIDHSNAKSVLIEVESDALSVQIMIKDNGIGIFNKIQQYLGLEDPKHAILELAKGKFTSDPKKHTGEGIFFTSRICDYFAILSDTLYFSGHRENDWLVENQESFSGTAVFMKMEKDSKINTADIFNEYSDPDKCPSFHKTCIPVKLMEYEGEALISRSQAKRLITRFDRFIEVVLDFEGVTEIGQGFADEIFRVFRNEYPSVNLIPVNCSLNVQRMIAHTSADYFQSEYND